MSNKPKVQINDGAEPAPVVSPSADIVRNANRVCETTDSAGRVLRFKRVRPLDRMRLFAVAGPELSGNQQWIGYAAIASSVTSIDGEAVPPPNNRREIEFLVERLDDHGLDAVGTAYAKEFNIAIDDATDGAIATAKN